MKINAIEIKSGMQRGNSPSRYAFTYGRLAYMLQIEDDDSYILSSSVVSRKPASKCKVLEQGDSVIDFCRKQKAYCSKTGILDIEIAFIRFMYDTLNGTSIWSK